MLSVGKILGVVLGTEKMWEGTWVGKISGTANRKDGRVLVLCRELAVPQEGWVVHRKCLRLAVALYGTLNYWGSPRLGLLSQLPICFKKWLGVMA